jgi:hypothetical protein
VDLTRFDFNVHNFLNSESVESMTDAEVGQYVLLLSKSWALAKDASLPDNPVMLARWAHCDVVSPNVLKKFPQVETVDGVRRRNGVLFTEWSRAMARSQQKRDAVNVRWGNSRNTPVSPDVLHPVIPKPNQSKPYQAVPDQTESETDMSMKKRILETAGKRSMSQFEADDVRRLNRLYGESLIEDFRAWMDEQPQGSDMYISSYLKVAENRLKGEQERGIIQSDPRINDIVARVYDAVQRAPRLPDVVKLLGAGYDLPEIVEAFQAYSEPLDDYERKFAAKTFFQDGAGEGIILARRQKKAADAALEASTKASIETGLEARRAEADARKKKIDEEEKLAEQLGDNPF